MSGLSDYHDGGEELMRILRLKTHPIALRLLRNESEVPAAAVRPLRDMGYHLALCQAFQMVRREGAVIAMLKEDNWCPEPVLGFGLVPPPDYFLEGRNRFPGDVDNLDAGRVFAEELPRLPVGECVGIVAAPLTSTPFEPGVVIIYCQPAQLNRLLLAREYFDGHNLPCELSSHAACVYGIVPVLMGQKTQVAVPCGGDRLCAMAGDDELLFSVAGDGLDELVTALRKLSAGKLQYRIRPEYPLSESYLHLAKTMGYLDES